MPKKYWLMKSEPDVYSIADLKKEKTACWEGVRNYQARNFMRDEMQLGDEVLYYHSNTNPPGVAGIAKVCKLAYPDFTQFDKKSKYFDPKASDDNPRWMMVDIEYQSQFAGIVSLEELKQNPKLEGMIVIQKGSRLSIQPVDKAHFNEVKKMASKKK